MIIHVVQPGDTLHRIGTQYGITLKQLMEDNQLSDPNRLVVGQTLVVMPSQNFHIVRPGDTIYSIAQSYGLTPQDILGANLHITNPSVVRTGQRLNLPIIKRCKDLIVNGYCFPDVDPETLNTSLPHLTYLSIFSYKVLPDGGLAAIDDSPAIREARQVFVQPKMVITNTLEGGKFDSGLAHTVLGSEDIQYALLNTIMATLEEKQYNGLDVDFECLYPEDRENYNTFLERARNLLHSKGYTLSTAIAPKFAAGQPGLLYEAHDYSFHGQAADEVILLTYEWGYLYGPPMAVAPIDQVRRVVEYAVTEIPPEKILMGIPNYGYDWTLPYVQGTPARVISNPEAVEIAYMNGADIQYDSVAQSPYFHYADRENRKHVVWFEDARSIYAKMRLVSEFNLEGVSYWTVNDYFPQNWLVASSLFDIVKR